ncbi:sentrin-specific protease 7-like isoform X2 [Megalops cyprinoides]|uniref:sentrin-specific protease 7-like isoform X2 n=1 Tax=Megalops cyprinoides TaxID=118141 RepID=UPI001863F67F|nr:sentrin-specific protease 7-like isoform X2 [Megalops cyprinoides]
MMSTPFKIPKRKSPESRCVQMESPLSRLQDTSFQKMQWTHCPEKGRKPQGVSPLNGIVSSNRSQPVQGKGKGSMCATLVLTDILKTELGLGYLNKGRNGQRIETCSDSNGKEPSTHSKQRDSPTHSEEKGSQIHSKMKDSQMHSRGRNPPTHSKQTDSQTHKKMKDAWTNSKQLDSRTFSNGLDSQPDRASWAGASEQRLSGSSSLQLNRSRPRRASDTLCGDRSQQTGSSPGQLRRSSVGLRDSSQSERSRAVEGERETDSKQTPRKDTGRLPWVGERESASPENSKRRKEISRREDLASENKEEERRRRDTSGPLRNGEIENGAAEWWASGVSRGSVLRHSGENMSGDKAPKCLSPEGSQSKPSSAGSVEAEPVGSRPDPQTRDEVQGYPNHDAHKPRVKRTPAKLPSSSSQPKKPKLSPTEPIVLSSDEDEGEVRRSSDSDTPFNPDLPLPQLTLDTNSESTDKAQVEATNALDDEPVQHLSTEELLDPAEIPQEPAIIELSFFALHVGSVRAEANGKIMITEDCINIPLKDSSGKVEVMVSLVASQLLRYGVWDGSVLWDRDEESPVPSLFFLWVSDAQAQLIQTELSAIHPVNSPGPASPFLLFTMCESLEGLQGVLLASLMEMLALHSGERDLIHPFSCSQGLAMIRSTGRDAHLLALLDQDVATDHNLEKQLQPGTSQTGLEPAPSEDDATLPRPSYTLCHSRIRDSYLVSITQRPSPTCRRDKHQGPPRRLILFPPPPSKGGITVTTEDLECLDSGEFLNDVIIDFYLKYLMLEKAPKTVAERSHIFSSFFYKQLTRKDNASEEASGFSAQHRRHQRVRTWTRHVDIFNKDYLFVPVNQEAHWYLVVICFPGLMEPQCETWSRPAVVGDLGVKRKNESQAEAQAVGGRQPNGIITKLISKGGSDNQGRVAGGTKGDGEKSPHGMLRSYSVPECTQLGCKRETILKRPCILIMDSLKLSFHERVLKLLREYLQVEWEVRRGTPRDFTSDQMKGSHCRVPLQDNSSDCGVYLLQYVETFLQNPVVHFELPLRLEHWFPRQQVRRKRDEIRDLVLQLYRKQGGVSGGSR